MLLWVFALIGLVAFFYHHWIYTRLLKRLVGAKSKSTQLNSVVKQDAKICILIPVYNEAKHMLAKVTNLAALDYPRENIQVHFGLDGCTDASQQTIQNALQLAEQQGLECYVHNFSQNRGKIQVVNQLIEITKELADIHVFTDASSIISLDALCRVLDNFEDAKVGVVSGEYQLADQHNDNELEYWQMQNEIRILESQVHSAIGVPGAFFAMRSKLIKPLNKNVINDDFVMPMLAACQGYRVVVDSNIQIVELQADQMACESKRRLRLGAGNLQQIFLLPELFKFSGLRLCFFSGKFLRGLMPSLLLLSGLSLLLLSVQGSVAAQAVTSILLSCIGAGCIADTIGKRLPLLSLAYYAFIQYIASLCGQIKYLLGHYSTSWKAAPESSANSAISDAFEQQKLVKAVKRSFDIVVASIGIIASAPIILLAMLAIKLDSKGDVIYRQLRVGEVNDQESKLFYIYKLRTMVSDAEAKSGAVWASKNDNRITKVGMFLRKTRIDELLQFINVLKGDMSIIGPRPERPCFYQTLSKTIPMYQFRTYGIKPGISGWAQVCNGYDSTIEDVRNKTARDYGYALALANFNSWLKLDLYVMLRTVGVMLKMQGR